MISQSCDGTIEVVFVMQLDVKPWRFAPAAAVRAACANVYFEQVRGCLRIERCVNQDALTTHLPCVCLVLCCVVVPVQAQQLYRIDNVLGDAREIMSQPPSPRNSDSSSDA